MVSTVTEPSRAILEAHLGGDHEATVLAKTDWLDDDAALDPLYVDFERRFGDTLATMVSMLGAPVVGLDVIGTYMPEALFAAGWTRADRTLVLAVVHHGRETPIVLQLASFGASEIEELAG